MESQRNIFLFGLLFVSYLIYQQWQQDYAPKPEVAITQTQTSVAAPLPTSTSGDVPVDPSAATAPALVHTNSQMSGQTIDVKTDVLELTISNVGGDIVKAKLLDYPVSMDSDESFKILDENGPHNYTARSGLIGPDGPDSSTSGRPLYHALNSSFVLADGTTELSVPLTYTNENGVEFIKTFTLKPGDHKVEVSYAIRNNSSKAVDVKLFAELKQTMTKVKSNIMMPVYRGGAYSSDEVRYQKYKYSEITEHDLNQVTKGGWVAMLEHYFVAAWLPDPDATNTLYSRKHGDFAHMGYFSPELKIAPGAEGHINAAVWIGPKIQSDMAVAAKHLDLTVDYGWLWFIAQPLFKLLNFLHSIVGNWGVAIILITLIVKGIMFPLTKAQYTSMAKMRMLQPKMQALRERFGDDRQKISQGMMALYKEEKVNPLGGCLPIFLQMPIFIALYWSLMESVELRHSPFMLWIQDLSVQDPYYILPLLMGASMFMIQKMSPSAVSDPMQQKVMQFMPVIFTFFFLWFPAGLVLYWLISNIVTLIQQTIIYRNLEKKGLHSRK
jgi:YidC/Oxa1 family membrane protein insertase